MIRKYNKNTKALGRIRKDFEGLFLSKNEIKLKVIIDDFPEVNENQKLITKEIIDTEKKEYRVTYEVVNLTEQEIALKQWEGGDLDIKVIAPIELVLTEFGVKMKGWFELLGLPIIPKGDKVHLYCAKIDEQFKATVDDLVSKNVLTIINKPK